MIQQLALPTFFVTFTFVEKSWDFLTKVLHTLFVSKLNLSNKIEDLQFVYIEKLIRIDPITFAKYYNH